MSQNSNEKLNQVILAIHSTDDSFGFAYRNKNKSEIDSLFIKKFDNDLCNNLIIDFSEFISKENIQQVNKIFVSTGPANFNASRLIIVLARTISQQIKCPLVGLSSFKLISRRIASNNNFLQDNQSFWIYKKLKRKGYIAGKYEVHMSRQKKGILSTEEKVIPKVIPDLVSKENSFEAKYDDEADLIELLDLSNKETKKLNISSWEKVLPLYPISPIN